LADRISLLTPESLNGFVSVFERRALHDRRRVVSVAAADLIVPHLVGQRSRR